MEQLAIIDNNEIHIYSASNHPIFNDDNATTEDIISSLGYDIDDVLFVWGENFQVIKEE